MYINVVFEDKKGDILTSQMDIKSPLHVYLLFPHHPPLNTSLSLNFSLHTSLRLLLQGKLIDDYLVLQSWFANLLLLFFLFFISKALLSTTYSFIRPPHPHPLSLHPSFSQATGVLSVSYLFRLIVQFGFSLIKAQNREKIC